MNRIICKIVFYFLVIVAVGGLNEWTINGPLLTNNTATSMNQFKGVSAPSGDFQIAGYWLTYSSVYIVEVLFLALVASVLFLPHLLRLIPTGKKG